MIDEERLFTLTKYSTTKGMIKKCLSDHNILFTSFDLSYGKQVKHAIKREQFNLNNTECQELFKTLTDETTKFTDILKNKEAFKLQALKFQRCLNKQYIFALKK